MEQFQNLMILKLKNKIFTNIENVDINKIIVPNKLSFCEKSFNF